ncbi:MAG TPA: GntR family transcriptional regulator [Pseudolabrys sp.]|nr:GntR family transcriptional regulator [Pseudolabrys sp.]
MYDFLPGLGAADVRQLLPYLPAGLVLSDDADGPARAYGEFKRMLLVQQLHPGQKVPLDEIAANLSMSRTPVREAMRRLEIEGFVSAIPNRGFLVRHIDAAEMGHLFEARQCIEVFTAGVAAKEHGDDFVEELAELQHTYARMLNGSADKRRLGMLADKAFHLRIARQAGNPFLIDLLSNLFDRLVFTRPLRGFPMERMQEAIAEHEAILVAIRERSAARARQQMLRNIEAGSKAIIEHLKTLELFKVAV